MIHILLDFYPLNNDEDHGGVRRFMFDTLWRTKVECMEIIDDVRRREVIGGDGKIFE